MVKKRLSFVIALIMSLALVQVVSADTPAPGGPFSTAFRVQNLSGTSANCVYTLYDNTGSSAYTSSSTAIAPGDGMFVFVPNISGLASGSYSAVVSCDQQVAAVTNFSDADSGASHSGISSPGTTWYAPGVYDNYYDFYSNIVVQNATGSTVDITVDYYAAGSASPVHSETQTNVPAYASANFEQEGLSQLSQNVTYSAKITGTGNIAPIVNLYGRGAVDNQLYSYNPVSSGATKVYAPVIMNNYYGYNTALTVQNNGTATTSVTITYGTGQIWSGDVGANASVAFYTPASGVPAGSLTGAVIESTSAGSGAQPIVALVNESNSFNRAASYIGFASGGTEVRLPIVMRRYYDYNTSITCQNVGSGSTTMTLEYGGVSGSNSSPSIAAGNIHLFYQPNDSLISDGFNGSATITASEPIVCVVNEDQNEGSLATTSMDQLYAYEGIAP
ncbi:MAG: hypothetical protein ACC700_11370 [Anaerolineales bacterium]